MNRVAVTALDGKYEAWEKRLKSFGLRLLRAARFRSGAFDIYVAPDRLMRRLNREFRGRDEPTTVLSFRESGAFPRPDLARGTRYLGEIFFDPDCIRRRGEDAESLLVHSFLHLLGYTHAGRNDKIKMEKKAQWLLSSLD